MLDNIELICTISDSDQVSVRLPLDNAGIAETKFAFFVEQLGNKLGQVYAAAETADSEEEQEQPKQTYQH